MGREARCRCRWGDRSAEVNALLESTELILRGPIRARIPLRDISAVRADAAALTFHAAGEPVTLELGAAEARTWAQKLTTPPPSLARKLGIGPQTTLAVRGTIDDADLAAALASAATQRARPATADLAVLRCDDARALTAFAERFAGLAAPPPLWIVYTKGKSAPLGEHAVRDAMRAHGFVDVKVAAVSAHLTALRFAKAP
jgi:hypothetical protein